MTPEYTARDARRDAWLADLDRLLLVLWNAAKDADPTIRAHPVGRRRP
jgi:hypothetical protein